MLYTVKLWEGLLVTVMESKSVLKDTLQKVIVLKVSIAIFVIN